VTRRPRHVFGPVPSRRLGRSLGIDLVPYKTCTYDCIYCQLGRTTNRVVARKEYAPLRGVLDELEAKLAAGASPDYITLSGSGEPTLYSRLDEMIPAVKRLTSIPLAVLTNGSLLWDPDVREELAKADLVMPSLDAGDERLFRRVNRPHPELSFDRIVEGMEEFCRTFSGEVWLEVLLLDGITATETEAAKIARLARRIDPDRIQLNTATRLPAESCAIPVPRERLDRLAGLFGGRADTIQESDREGGQADSAATEKDVLDLLRRRPCTLPDVCRGLRLREGEAAKRLDGLVKRGLVSSERRDGVLWYRSLATGRYPHLQRPTS
jgi:wyosine [tRNA(Phe)-imidazoG37] synthetase (radical SAM superfamily)